MFLSYFTDVETIKLKFGDLTKVTELVNGRSRI